MKIILAYALMLFLAPTFGAIGSIVLMPVTIAVARWMNRVVAGTLSGSVQSFFAVYAGLQIFRWFGIAPGILMIAILGVAHILNDLSRFATRGMSEMQIGYFVGDVCGLLLGAVVLLPK